MTDLLRSLTLVLSSTLLSVALRTDQSGSAWEYSKALSALTAAMPSAWMSSLPATKKPPIARFREYLKRGSQGGPPKIWTNIDNIFQHLPRTLLRDQLSEAQSLLEAMHDGILRKDEPRAYLQTAWANYFSVAHRLLMLLSNNAEKCKLVKEEMLPIFEQQFRSTEDSRWSIGQHSAKACAAVFNNIIKDDVESLRQLLEAEWWRLSQLLIEDIKLSLPAQSKEFDKSQKSVANEGLRWAQMNGGILEIAENMAFARPLLRKTSLSITESILQVVETRNGMDLVTLTFYG